jgi:hypothetical protein
MMNADRYYTAEELAGAFQVALVPQRGRPRADIGPIVAEEDPLYTVLRDRGMLNGSIGPNGDYGMTCPWAHEHTGGISTGTATAYKPGGLWNCFHSRCRHRRLDDLLAFLREEHDVDTDALIRNMPGAAGKLLRAARRYVYVLEVGEFVDLESGEIVHKDALDDYYYNVAPGFSHLLLARDDLRRVERVTYRPGAAQLLDREPAEDEEARCSAVNQWRPGNVRPAAAAVDESRAQPWLEHLAWLFPDPTERLMVLDFLTHLVQRRGDKINWGLVLLAPVQGAGRDTLVTPVRDIIGQRNVSYIGAKQIEGQFNDFWVSELVSISELDTTEASRWQIYQRLKDAMATPPYYVRINTKYVKEHEMPKVANVLLITNDAAAVALPDVDRRFGVAETARDKEEVRAYKTTGVFSRLHAAYAEPGWLANFYANLLQRQISPTFDAKGDAPDTPAKHRMMRAAEHPAKTQVREWIAAREGTFAYDLFESRNVYEDLWRDGVGVEERLVHAYLRDLGAQYVGRITDNGVQRRLWAVRNVSLYKAKAQQPGALAAAYHQQRRRGVSVLDDLLS